MSAYSNFLADLTAQAFFGEWWMECYVTDPNGVSQTLRFGRRGKPSPPNMITVTTGSTVDTIPANTPFQKRLLTIPTYTQSLWTPPAKSGGAARIGGLSSPSYGSAELRNADGGLDQYHPNSGWRWAGGRVKVFNLDYRPQNISSAIGKYIDARLGAPQFALDKVTVPIVGRESDFDQPISQRVFRGRPWWGECYNGAQVAFGAASPSAINLRGDMTIEAWGWIEALPSVAGVIHGFNNTPSPWRLRQGDTGAGSIRLAATISGSSQFAPSASFTLPTLTMFHLAVVVSGTTVIYYLWNDDTQTLTVDSHANAFTTATRDTVGAGISYIFGSATNGRRWVHDLRVYNVARSQSDIESDRFGLSTAVPASLVHWATFDDGGGTSVVDSSASGLTGTISGGTFTWIPSFEGASALQGIAKPETWGHSPRMKPQLVDANTQTYMVCGSGACESIVHNEGGLDATMLSEATSLRAFLTETNAAIVTAGGVRPYSARGLYRLGDAPKQPVAANVFGRYRSGGVRTIADLIQNIALNAGTAPLPLSSGGLDSSAFTTFAATSYGGAEAGLFVAAPASDPSGIHNGIDALAMSAFATWGYWRGQSTLHAALFSGAAASPAYTFTQRDIIAIQDMGAAAAVVYQVVVLFSPNYVPLSGGQVDGSIQGTAAEYLLGQQWQSVTATNNVLRAANPGAGSISITVQTMLTQRSAAQALAQYILGILGQVGVGWKATVKATGRQVTQGDTVALSFTTQMRKKRLNLDGTKNFIVLSTGEHRQDGSIDLDLWGAAA